MLAGTRRWMRLWGCSIHAWTKLWGSRVHAVFGRMGRLRGSNGPVFTVSFVDSLLVQDM